MAKKSFVIDVAPLTVLPFRKAVFSYYHTKQLEPGAIVVVPFSGQSLSGIVLKSRTTTIELQAELKNISSVEERPILTKQQIALAQAVSTMTFTPLGKVLKHFVPKKAKVRKILKQEGKLQRFITTEADDTRSKKMLNTLQKCDSLFVSIPAHARGLMSLLALIKSVQRQHSGQILFLVPDISTAVRLEKSWMPYYKPDEIVSLYHTKTAGQYYEAWESIQTGHARIIIATRHGMFAPFQDLQAIMQLDPADESYKQWDMSPRYHAEHVIPSLQKIWQAKYVGVGVLPSLSLLKNEFPWIGKEKYEITPERINLKIERYQKNWGIFSVPLQSALKEALGEKQQVLLYVHQGGLESFSVCKECRTIFRCPNCKNALKLTLSDHYHCKFCNFKSNLFPACPNCKNIHFKSVGYGTEKVAKEVQKLLPGALVKIADKNNLGDHKKVDQFLENTSKNEPDILIATSSYLRFPPLSCLTLVAIIDADILLNLPGFRKDEQFIELIEKAKSLLSAIPKGKLLVQSYHPESDLFHKIEHLEIQTLLETLLAERKTLRYPPEYRCFLLTARPKLKHGAEFLQKSTSELKVLLTKNSALKKNTLVQSLERKERGKLQKYTLVRYLPPLQPLLSQFLEKRADTILIDHDPLHIT